MLIIGDNIGKEGPDFGKNLREIDWDNYKCQHCKKMTPAGHLKFELMPRYRGEVLSQYTYWAICPHCDEKCVYK